jgi:hypothetical protein
VRHWHFPSRAPRAATKLAPPAVVPPVERIRPSPQAPGKFGAFFGR